MPTKKLIACSYFLVGNQRDSVGIRLGPSCELLAGSYFLVTTAPFCVVAANVRNRSGPKQRHEIEQACESKRRRARGGDRDLATRRRCVITTVSSSKRGSCSSHGTRAMRCRCDANAVVGAPAKSRSKRVWKSIFSLLESFLALLPQKRNFRFLFLNQYKLGVD